MENQKAKQPNNKQKKKKNTHLTQEKNKVFFNPQFLFFTFCEGDDELPHEHVPSVPY